MHKGTLVTGVIGADIHNIGLRILETALEDAGFKVVSLGVLASQDDFVRAAIEVNANAVLVSSLNGHGELECPGLREKCIEAGLTDLLLYAGGNLMVGKHAWEDVKARFVAMGFDRVYPPATHPRDVVPDLATDIAAQGRTAA